MSDALLLVPDFLLILCGFALCRYTTMDRPVWEAVERLVYYLLFPVLLFNSIVRSPMQLASTASLLYSGLLIVGFGISASYLLGQLPRVNPRLHASGAQTAFRFNSYIALALAERLAGPEGVAWIAVLIAICVPLCNFAAVWPLARHGGHDFWKEIARNPLIISTVAGLLANLAGLRFPDPMASTLSRIGQAALPLGLMAVGAGLRLGELKSAPALASGFLGIKHLGTPIVALLVTPWLGLSAAQQLIVVAFAALPTASSAYVLAIRMGGSGPFVAGLVTLSTLLGMMTVPLWLAVLRSLR